MPALRKIAHRQLGGVAEGRRRRRRRCRSPSAAAAARRCTSPAAEHLARFAAGAATEAGSALLGRAIAKDIEAGAGGKKREDRHHAQRLREQAKASSAGRSERQVAARHARAPFQAFCGGLRTYGGFTAAASRATPSRPETLQHGGRRRAKRRRAGAATVIRGQFFAAPPLEPGLYVVATPIGNLGDVTLRALDTLAGRGSPRLRGYARDRSGCSTRYGIDAKLTAYHEHSGPERAPAAARGAGRGAIGGARLRRRHAARLRSRARRWSADAVAAGHRVVPIPGASALVAALSASGLPADPVLFIGFLPSKPAARRTAPRKWSRPLPRRSSCSNRRTASPRTALRRGGTSAAATRSGSGLPRADEDPRDFRSRHARRARRALCRCAR